MIFDKYDINIRYDFTSHGEKNIVSQIRLNINLVFVYKGYPSKSLNMFKVFFLMLYKYVIPVPMFHIQLQRIHL
jgi:hypothetical protein